MIEVKNLSKRFGPKLAVDNVSFSVERGEVLGFLGPNGAGKSTTMRMVTGYLPPSAGSVSIAGVDAVGSPIEAKRKIGYLPESAPLYADMSVSAFLRFVAELRGLSGAEKQRAVDKSIETCFLQPVRQQSIDTLSKGYRHRTCLAQSILHDPEILILDEPTDGLDPNQKQEVRNLIKRMGEEKAILFSTHILEEVDAACTRAIIIDQGRVVADGTPDELKARSKGAGRITLRISGASGADARVALEALSGVKEVLETSSGETSFAGQVVPGKAAAGLSETVFNLCKDRGWVIEELRVEEGRLDDMFRELTVADTKLADAGRPAA